MCVAGYNLTAASLCFHYLILVSYINVCVCVCVCLGAQLHSSQSGCKGMNEAELRRLCVKLTLPHYQRTLNTDKINKTPLRLSNVCVCVCVSISFDILIPIPSTLQSQWY